MKILLSAYTGLGNFVLKTPFIQQIHAQFPGVLVDIITGNNFGIDELAQHHPLINKVHYVDAKEHWQKKVSYFKQTIKQQHYNVLFMPFDAQPNWLQMAAYFAQIPLIIKHYVPHKKQTLSQKIANRVGEMLVKTTKVEVLPNRHETALNVDLLTALTHTDTTSLPATSIYYQAKPQTLIGFGLHQPYIVVQPGAANGVFNVKAWHPKHFIALIDKLNKQYPSHKIVIVGDKGDNETAIKHIYRQLSTQQQQAIINTAGQTTINDLLNILALAQLVICHDSGVMHLADALSVPLIALYGPTDYARTCPLRATSAVLMSNTPYKNAMHHFALTEANLAQQGIAHKAMDGISVEQVLALTAAFLADKD